MKKIGLALLILILFSGIFRSITGSFNFNLFDNMKLNILVYFAVASIIFWGARKAYNKFS